MTMRKMIGPALIVLSLAGCAAGWRSPRGQRLEPRLFQSHRKTGGPRLVHRRQGRARPCWSGGGILVPEAVLRIALFRTRSWREGPTNMKHPMLGVLGLGFLGAAPSSNPVECGNPYVAFHERLSHHAENLSGERLAALHRVSLRIFDACDAGHLRDVQAKFVELEMRLGAPGKCEQHRHRAASRSNWRSREKGFKRLAWPAIGLRAPSAARSQKDTTSSSSPYRLL